MSVWKQMGLGITETENIGDDPDEMGDSLSAANLGGVCAVLYIYAKYISVTSSIHYNRAMIKRPKRNVHDLMM